MSLGTIKIISLNIPLIPENLPPSELKKLRNKQRKAKKKAELESAQQAQNQIKKEQQQKKHNNQDGDPEAPQLDELIPDKLSRPENPLEKAIEFLKPLQQLAKDNIETHLMAFEIYYRKNKLLLMLQSLKRARTIDPDHPRLHSCIIKFYRNLDEKIRTNDIDENVKVVIEKERQNLFKSKSSAQEINELFLAANKTKVAACVEVAKCMYLLDPAKKSEAVNLVTSVDVEHITLQVKFLVFTGK